MVVGRGHRHHLRDAERPDLFGVGLGPLGRVGDRAGRDDRALTLHQPRDRGHRSDPARVGQGEVGAGEVVGGQLVVAGPRDQILVGRVEAGEVEPVGPLDRWHDQGPRAVVAFEVDRETEVQPAVVDHLGLAVGELEVAGHHGPVANRLDDRPGDQVGEGELHAPVGEGRVQGLPAGIEPVHRDRPEGGGGRDFAAFVHRPGEGSGRATEGRRPSGSPGPVAAIDHVGLGHLAARSGAVHRAEVDPLGRGDPPGDRGGPVAVSGLVADRTTVRLGSRSGGPVGGGGRTVVPAGPFRRRAPGFHLGQHCSDRYVLVRLDREAGHRAGGRRRDLGIDLVGRDLDQGVALLDPVADRDVPLEDGSLGHRLAHLGHRHFEGRGFRHRV